MKKKFILLIVLFTILGCNQEKIVDSSELTFIKGKVYVTDKKKTLIGKNKPFSGKVISNSRRIERKVDTLNGVYENSEIITWGEEGYEGYYKNGIKEGRWIYYSPENKIIKEGDYKNGYKNGTWIYYSRLGVKLYEVNYNLFGEKPEDYLENEITFSKKIAYLKNSDKKISGLVFSRYPSGKIEKVTYYKEGKKDGEEIYFFEDEVIRATYKYKDGKLNGNTEINYSSGNKKIIGNYLNGKKEGKWIYYSENGEIKEEKLFKDEKLVTSEK